ncbi:MAG: MOSC domain-containing protein [Pseudomonadota bacterium]
MPITTPPTIVSVCVGQPRQLGDAQRSVQSGIVKRPVTGSVAVGYKNLAGDGQADLSVHGGRDKAIYVYSHEHYAYWRDVLDRDLAPAQFGENLTVAGLTEVDAVIGARYRIGSAEVVVAQPRLPCFKLGLHIGDERFPATFLQSGRLGFYLRVVRTGELVVGDRFELLDTPADGLSVTRLWELVFAEPQNVAHSVELQHALDELPYLDDGWRRRLRGRLRATGEAAP